MARVRLNSSLLHLKGALGNIVFKMINGQLHATQIARPKKKKKKSKSGRFSGTPKQMAWRAKFHHATRFAKAVKSDPKLLAFYTALARQHQMRLRDICVSDRFTVPKIEGVDLSGYHGSVGDRIRFRASDKYGLAEVKVTLLGPDGVYEAGPAVLKRNTWEYRATLAMPPGKVRVHLRAADHTQQNAVYETDWFPPAESK